MKVAIPVAIAVVLAAARAQAAPTRLTLEEALAQAMRRNPQLAAAQAREAGAEALARSAGRRLAPSVRLSDEVQRYDKPFAIAFVPLAMPGAPAPAFVAREETTHTFAAMVDQPVLGLLRLEQERRAQDALARAGDAQARSTAAGLREAIALGFLRHFEARALERVAQASLDELQQQQEVARARLASGVATEADVLRIQTAVANARQQAIGARSQAEVARVGVLADVGLGADERDVELIEPSALLARSASQPAAAEAPLRPELELRLQQASAAEHQARGRGFALLPDVDLEAAYLRVDGQKFAPANSLYVGLRAQWAVWEWGASLQQHRAAVHQARAARADAQAERLQIDREVATAQAQEVAASAAVDAARAAIASAEEAYRVTDAQVRAGTATTTDLIEAQAALTQARSNLTRAEYGVAVARVALAYARGE